MRVLFIGDIVGKGGRRAIKEILPRIKEGVDLCLGNGENAAGGIGLTPKIAEEILSFGIDILTTGNHIWDKKEIVEWVDRDRRVLRPANYPLGVPGSGSVVFETQKGHKVGIINLAGRVFMSTLDCPFRTADREIEKLKERTKVTIVDMHAEATSEKMAMGWYLDGKVSAVVGTHTHVQTADERILPQGTAYITDVGMTGPLDSVIGVKTDLILRRFLMQMPIRFEVADSNIHLCAVILELDEATGQAKGIERIQVKL